LCKIKEKALKLANKKIAFVGSVNENNAPNIKVMVVEKHHGLKTFYFTSSHSAMWTEHYKRNFNACLYFNSVPIYKGLMLEGIMKVFNNDDLKEAVWRNNFINPFKNSVVMDNPDYCVLRFTAKKGRYHNWFKTEVFEIE